jgi:EmrB/QacA subfamily drug resistance transporter
MITALRSPCDGAVVRAVERSSGCAERVQRWTLAATILGSSMVFIDGSVVNLALPEIRTSLNAGPGAIQWVVEAYTLLLSSLVLVGGALGDHFGRRRVFALGIVSFALASAACGLAQSAAELVAARAAQGIGGALLVPGSLAIIGATFQEARRARAFGAWSSATAITSLAGPALGGWLIALFGWRSVFFVNLPFALVTLAITLRFVPESHPESAKRPLDWTGAALVSSALLGLTYGLIEWQSHGMNLRSTGSLGAAAAALGLFLFVEKRSSAPMVPLELFRSRTFSGTNLLTLLLYAAVGGALFYLPFNLIEAQGYSVLHAGWALIPFILLMFVLSRAAERLIDRFGTKRLLTLGPLIAAAGFALFAIPEVGGSYWTTFFPACIVLGLGMGITVAPLTNAVMSAVAAERSGIASGINNAVARAAGLIAIAAFGLLHGATRAADQSAAAYVAGFRKVMLLAAALALMSALAAAILIEARHETRPSD